MLAVDLRAVIGLPRGRRRRLHLDALLPDPVSLTASAEGWAQMRPWMGASLIALLGLAVSCDARPVVEPDRGDAADASALADITPHEPTSPEAAPDESAVVDAAVEVPDAAPSLPPPCMTLGWGALRTAAVAPDGLLLAGGYSSGRIALYRVTDGAVVGSWAAHDDGVTGMAFSPDGRRLASGAEGDPSVRVWSVPDGGQLLGLPASTFGGVAATAFSPDGVVVAGLGADATVRLWRATDGAELRVLPGLGLPPSALVFSPDGTLLAAGAGGDLAETEVRVWRLPDGALVHRHACCQSRGSPSLAFSPDGSTLVVAPDFAAAMDLWRTRDWVLARTVDLGSSIGSVAFSADGAMLAGGARFDATRVWRTGDWLPITSLEAWRPALFLPDSQTLVTGGSQNRLKVWNAASGAEIRSFGTEGHRGPVAFIAVGGGSGTILSGGDDGLRLWRLADGGALGLVEDPAERAAVSRDGTLAATARWGGSITVWRVSDRSVVRKMRDGQPPPTAMAFLPDGATLAVCAEYGVVSLLRLGDGVESLRIKVPEGSIFSLAAAPDGSLIAGSDANGRLSYLFRVADGSLVGTMEGTGALAFSPDGRRLAIGGSVVRVDDRATLWSASGVVYSSAFSPDGGVVAMGATDGSLRIFGAADGSEVSRLSLRHGVRSVAFSPDGSRLVAGTHDGIVHVLCVK